MVNQHIKIMGWESSGVVGFDLGPLLHRSNEDSQR